MTTGKRKYKPGDVLSTKIAVSANENILNWINEQESISKSIFNLINQYANGELLHIETVNKMLSFSDSKIVNAGGNRKTKVIETEDEKKGFLIENESRNNIGMPQNERKAKNIKVNSDENLNLDSGGDENNDRKNSEEKEQCLRREPTIRVPNRRMPFKPAEITKGIDKK